MKKLTVFFAVLLLCMLCLLAGCQEADETTADKAADTTAAEITTKEEESLFIFEGEHASVLPKGKTPEKLYVASTPSTTADLLSLVSLQGIYAKNTSERIFIQYDSSAKLFLDTVKKQYNNCEVSTLSSLWLFLKKDTSKVSGYILTDTGDDSINVATSVAGFLNAIIVTKENESSAKGVGLTCLLDVSDKDDTWLRTSEYWDRLSRDVAFMHHPGNTENLRDYAIMCGAYMFTDQISTREALTARIRHMNDGFIILGWNTALGELDTVRALGNENGSIIPADYAKNLATLSSFPLCSAKQQTKAGEEASKLRHTVTVVISDGDNLQWALNTLPTSRNWFKNPARGDYALGWGLPASLIDVAPPVMEYYYSNMKENEEFIMQLSGLGYTFPSYWKSPEALAEMQKKMGDVMERADMSVMEILDDVRLNQDKAEYYYGGFLKEDSIDGILYIDYSDYSCYNGQIFWANGKPIVAARYRIWADYTNIDSLAASINSAPANLSNEKAYSFIIVHAWSGLDANGKVVKDGNTVDAVTALVEKLDDNVDVVTPSEFIRRITEYVDHSK